jgi:hypothetical protein
MMSCLCYLFSVRDFGGDELFPLLGSGHVNRLCAGVLSLR